MIIMPFTIDCRSEHGVISNNNQSHSYDRIRVGPGTDILFLNGLQAILLRKKMLKNPNISNGKHNILLAFIFLLNTYYQLHSLLPQVVCTLPHYDNPFYNTTLVDGVAVITAFRGSQIVKRFVSPQTPTMRNVCREGKRPDISYLARDHDFAAIIPIILLTSTILLALRRDPNRHCIDDIATTRVGGTHSGVVFALRMALPLRFTTADL
ncbi:hypothetical protein QTP88_020165 [Uroleucon formosanum]